MVGSRGKGFAMCGPGRSVPSQIDTLGRGCVPGVSPIILMVRGDTVCAYNLFAAAATTAGARLHAVVTGQDRRGLVESLMSLRGAEVGRQNSEDTKKSGNGYNGDQMLQRWDLAPFTGPSSTSRQGSRQVRVDRRQRVVDVPAEASQYGDRHECNKSQNQRVFDQTLAFSRSECSVKFPNCFLHTHTTLFRAHFR